MGGKVGKLSASHGDFSVLKKERENEIVNRVCDDPLKSLLGKFVRSGERNRGGAVRDQ